MLWWSENAEISTYTLMFPKFSVASKLDKTVHLVGTQEMSLMFTLNGKLQNFLKPSAFSILRILAIVTRIQNKFQDYMFGYHVFTIQKSVVIYN